MKIIIAILGLLFIIGNVQAEWRNRKTMAWQSNALSSYLAGVPGSNLQDIGYLLFAVGILLTGILFGGTVNLALGIAGALALVLVVATKLVIYKKGDPKGYLEKAHVISAAVAFLSMTALLIRHALLINNQIVFALAAAAPISALLFMMFEPEETTLEEKDYTGFLLAALGVALIV